MKQTTALLSRIIASQDVCLVTVNLIAVWASCEGVVIKHNSVVFTDPAISAGVLDLQGIDVMVGYVEALTTTKIST